MKLYDFKLLPDQEQYYIVFTKGEYLDLRIEGGRRFVLYAVELFFVEVEYDNVNNKIINKRAFVAGEILNKYSRI